MEGRKGCTQTRKFPLSKRIGHLRVRFGSRPGKPQNPIFFTKGSKVFSFKRFFSASPSPPPPTPRTLLRDKVGTFENEIVNCAVAFEEKG